MNSAIEIGSKLLDVKPDVLTEFEVEDTFNPGNRIAGVLCRQSDHRYGALVITSVNGCDVDPQMIYCTPKLHYPFGSTDEGDRKYHWPKDVKQVEVYIKLDGTNLNAYSYADASGKRFMTFKTRLVPVVQESRFGSFASMWQEILDANPSLVPALSAVLEGKYTVSFEMYGYRNRHLILYPEALDAKMLFFVDQKDGTPHPPSMWPEQHPWMLTPNAALNTPEGLTEFYNQKRDEAEAQNKKVKGDEGDDLIEGMEGFIFYVLDGKGRWNLEKCKPPSIEDIHWTGDTIPLSRIMPTAWNGLESCPDGVLTVEYVRQLLLEEFAEHTVNASQLRIERAVQSVNASALWRERVREAYLATGLNMTTDGKAPVMRALSKGFSGPEMKRVYSALKSLGIAKD